MRRTARSISPPNNRSFSFAAIFSTSKTCLKNLRTKWPIKLADSKASTRPSNVKTPRLASIHPACKSVVSLRKSLRTKMVRRSIFERPARLRWLCGTKRSKATGSIITRMVSAHRLANGNKHRRRRNCLPTISCTRLELLRARKPNWNSSVASSFRAGSRKSCVATGNYC